MTRIAKNTKSQWRVEDGPRMHVNAMAHGAIVTIEKTNLCYSAELTAAQCRSFSVWLARRADEMEAGR